MSVNIKAFLRKSLPFLAGGAIALSAATAANAASGYKMINPEDFKRGDYSTPYYLYDYPYLVQEADGSAGEEGGSPEFGGILDDYCVYASLHFPQGAQLEAIKLHVGGGGLIMVDAAAELPFSEYNFDVEIWKVSPDRTQLNTLLSENISNEIIIIEPDSAADGHTPDPYEFALNETSNPKKFLYTLRMCGYGEIFSGRILYSVED